LLYQAGGHQGIPDLISCVGSLYQAKRDHFFHERHAVTERFVHRLKRLGSERLADLCELGVRLHG
jgi:hypothetical protein